MSGEIESDTISSKWYNGRKWFDYIFIDYSSVRKKFAQYKRFIVISIKMRKNFNLKIHRMSPLTMYRNVERSFQSRPWIKLPVEERAELLIPQIWQIPWDDTLTSGNNCSGQNTYTYTRIHAKRIQILSYVARVNRRPHDLLIRLWAPSRL